MLLHNTTKSAKFHVSLADMGAAGVAATSFSSIAKEACNSDLSSGEGEGEPRLVSISSSRSSSASSVSPLALRVIILYLLFVRCVWLCYISLFVVSQLN